MIIKLSIIIINYKCEKYIERCLNSIYFDGEYEIIIVDNGNNPELMQKISKFPRVRIIPFVKNYGFAEGNNIAIRQAQGEYICTLNADVFLTEEYLNKCVEFLEKHRDFSSVQGKLLSEKNHSIIDSTGNMMTKSRFAQNINHRDKDNNVPAGEVFGVCAAAAVYRREFLEKAKINNDYFDSDFFAYLEDVDLDWRLRLKGFKAYFLNTVVASHIRESSTNIMFRVRQAFINRIYLIIKNDSRLSVIVNILLFWPTFIIYGHRKKNIGLIFEMFKKRRKIQKSRIVSPSEIKLLIEKTPWKKMLLKLFRIG